MRRHTLPLLFLTVTLAASVIASCTDDLIGKQPVTATVDESDLVETHLILNVAMMGNFAASTRATGDEPTDPDLKELTDEEKRGTGAERRIDNIWVFQFGATDSALLIQPRYYDISAKNASPDETETNGVEVAVLLKPDVKSIVYVVANTDSATWATADNSATLGMVLEKEVPHPDCIAVGVDGVLSNRIPMEGASGTVTPTDNGTITVKVTRMYAKVEITIGDIPETLDITSVVAGNIPFYCRVGSLDLDDENDYQRGDYPQDTKWTSCALEPGKRNSEGAYADTLILYLPENLQGRNTQGHPNQPELKTNQAFADAFYLNFKADYYDDLTGDNQAGRSYVFYPGANDYNDYNIKRNYVYRTTLNIYSDLYNQATPSSNCFVVKPGQLLSFLPYYRTEEGGGYKFTDYLDATGDESKRINDDRDDMTQNVEIIWQTKDAIGDNSDGSLVKIDPCSSNPSDDRLNRKIHVRAGKEGNALIAAYNSNHDIVWSWHIWVTENDPANIGKAVTYSTYAWNETGIKTDIRVPGYAIMPCNLGALKYEPDNVNTVDPGTHGMLYQWGRKDPFPPSKTYPADKVDYTEEYTGPHYGNDNTTKVGKTAGTARDSLFHSLAGDDIATAIAGTNAIKYAIQNPTVFICGAKKAGITAGAANENNVNDKTDYAYDGDWMPDHDNKLWGGLEPSRTSDMKFYTYDANEGAHLFDNYGDQKSIFDPCPSGWRVPPGDLWIGFTKTGVNPESYDEINTSTTGSGNGAGLYMYMTDWRNGTTSFFPTQGNRVPDGAILRTGGCGNYHNATTDEGNRVNILHIHRNATLFNVFELTYLFYHVKSTCGPIRCVRDHK